MRVFLALETPYDIKEYLSLISGGMAKRVPGVKWIKGEDLHVTLKFLGEIDETMIREIETVTADVGGQHPAVDVRLKEITAFPDLKRARVIVVTFQEGVDNMRAIFHDIEGRLVVQGIQEEKREFTPHITLGRAKIAAPILKRDVIPLEEKRFLIDNLVLYQSVLTKTGALYTPLKEIKLERNNR